MNQSTLKMEKEEWLSERQKGIGGSDVAAILGINKWKTPLDVYYEKISETPIHTIETPKMKAGLMLEQVIADWYAEETGKKVVRDNKIRVHPHYPFLIANLDRVILGDQNTSTGILECKTTSGYAAKNWDTEIPLYYYCQLQHYLNVTGYNWGEIAILIDGWDFQRFYFEKDIEFCEALEIRLKDFWINHVLAKVPPALLNESDVIKQFPQHESGKTLIAKGETFQIITMLRDVKNRIKILDEKKAEYETQLKIALEDAEAFIDEDGVELVTYKSPKDSLSFDKDSFKKDNPDLYNKYLITKPGARRFLVK